MVCTLNLQVLRQHHIAYNMAWLYPLFTILSPQQTNIIRSWPILCTRTSCIHKGQNRNIGLHFAWRLVRIGLHESLFIIAFEYIWVISNSSFSKIRTEKVDLLEFYPFLNETMKYVWTIYSLIDEWVELQNSWRGNSRYTM